MVLWGEDCRCARHVNVQTQGDSNRERAHHFRIRISKRPHHATQHKHIYWLVLRIIVLCWVHRVAAWDAHGGSLDPALLPCCLTALLPTVVLPYCLLPYCLTALLPY